MSESLLTTGKFTHNIKGQPCMVSGINLLQVMVLNDSLDLYVHLNTPVKIHLVDRVK